MEVSRSRAKHLLNLPVRSKEELPEGVVHQEELVEAQEETRRAVRTSSLAQPAAALLVRRVEILTTGPPQAGHVQ